MRSAADTQRGPTALLLTLHGEPDSDIEELDRLTRSLRAQLLELDVDSVEAVQEADLPAGAKGPEPITIGALLIALSASGGVFTSVIGAVKDWLERQIGRHRVSITIDGDTIELDRATTDQQTALVDAFIRRHIPPR